jgi:MFS transporter, SP family, sugar:H+ symporter
LYIVERLGRRLPLIVGATWQACWLLIFASIGIALPPVDNPVAGTVMIVAACMFIASFAMTWGPFACKEKEEKKNVTAYTLTTALGVVIGETFPLRTRAKQASLATASNWLGNFLIAFLTPFANDGIGYAFGFVFFGCNAAAAIMVYFFLYETKSLSLENVDAMYSDETLKAWQSKKWIPAGYIDRNRRDSAYWNRRTSAAENIRRASVQSEGRDVSAKHWDDDSIERNEKSD